MTNFKPPAFDEETLTFNLGEITFPEAADHKEIDRVVAVVTDMIEDMYNTDILPVFLTGGVELGALNKNLVPPSDDGFPMEEQLYEL